MHRWIDLRWVGSLLATRPRLPAPCLHFRLIGRAQLSSCFCGRRQPRPLHGPKQDERYVRWLVGAWVCVCVCCCHPCRLTPQGGKGLKSIQSLYTHTRRHRAPRTRGLPALRSLPRRRTSEPRFRLPRLHRGARPALASPPALFAEPRAGVAAGGALWAARARVSQREAPGGTFLPGRSCRASVINRRRRGPRF